MESKYQFLINGRKTVGIKKIEISKELSGYSQTIDNAYENLEDYNPRKERKVFKVFGDVITDMESNKKK